MADAAPPPRPRPRPRPKPIAKNATNGNAVPSSSSSSLLTSKAPEATRRASAIEDEDEYFMKNRNRSSKTWQKLDQITKGPSHKTQTTKHEDPSDSEAGSSPRSRSKNNKRTKRDKSTSVPLWQQRKDLARILSQGPDSDDSDIEITGEEIRTPNGKRKRANNRSRSRSITPPPAVSQAQIQNAKNVVRQTLQAALNALAREIAAGRGSSLAPESETATATTGDNIVFVVKWQPHPLDTQAQHGVEWQYRTERTDNFRELFEATAEDANIPVDNLIMTYEGKRIFRSVTPQTLKIWADNAELVAYEKRAYEYIQNNPHSIVRAAASTASMATEPHPTPNASQQPTHQESDAESQSDAGNDDDDEDDKFKLILRSAQTGDKDITLTVRPTTKCGAILRAFLKKAGLADRPEYKDVFAGAGAGGTGKSKGKQGGKGKDPRLCVDGDKMDNQAEIGDADLEDGDMVEVVGL
ncbi:hypothetical protein M413DRAFT_443821 [Hebeloma cylindrosporum]|uniref:Uncharacterized protein n=1 Tax=Hebeloma cylindrosporum TaxID=76867 RepID=A0A0C3CHA8_HEBCY|nr:hypothetical protein M413DRAFT_443821 [Hebeloma cylindrosporum h7]